MFFSTTLATPLGPLKALMQDGALTHLILPNDTPPPCWATARPDSPLFAPLADFLTRYFAGDSKATLSLPLAPVGTAFQRQVWATLRTIPYGTTWSYAQLASTMGAPKAMRAVGNANGRNPLPLLIPCHRVIASGGSLGGYSGGLDVKRFLLKLEGNVIA